MNSNWKDYLENQGVNFFNNSIQSYPTPTKNLQEITDACFCIIEDLSVAAITGADSKKFLQGQLTCNLENLTNHRHTLAAACTPKGKTYSNFRLLQTSENHWLLAPHRSILDTTLEKLRKYSVFYQTTIQAEDKHLIFGLMGTNVLKALTLCVDNEKIPNTAEIITIDNGYLLKTTDKVCERFELWIPKDDFIAWWNRLSKYFTPILQKNWLIQNILSVIPWITASLVEKYIPQELNLTSLGFVSFRKGCYTGQEIVARVQNLGTPKSRTYAIKFKSTKPIESIILQDNTGKKVGYFLQYETLENKQIALVNLQISAAETNNIFLNIDPNIPISIQPIPYNIDPANELLY